MMPERLSAEQIDLVLDAIQSIGGTVVNIRRYPPGSTIVKMALERGTRNIEKLFVDLETFTLGESERQLLLNDQRLPEKMQQRAYVARFLQTLIERNIRSLTFNRGLAPEELVAFVEVVGQSPEELKAIGNLNELLRARNVFNLSIDEKVFVALMKDQVIAEAAELDRLHQEGSAGLDGFHDGSFIRYFFTKLQQVESDLPKEQLAELKKAVNFEELKDAKTIDYGNLGPMLAEILEKLNREAAENEAQTTQPTESAVAPTNIAATISPDLAKLVQFQEETVYGDTVDSLSNERAEKLTRTFQSIAESILSIKQPEIRSKLINDLLKIITNFKTVTLAYILASQMVQDPQADADLKNHILIMMSLKKKSAVIDFFLRKYQRLIEGLSPVDFEINPQFLGDSEHLLQRVIELSRQIHPSSEIEEKAGRALNMVRNLRKEAPDPEKLLILKVRRLLGREPSFLLEDNVQAFLPDLIIRLLDLKRPDVAKKVLERLFENTASDNAEIRIRVAGVLVRVSQALLNIDNTALHPALYGLLLRGYRKETNQKIYAAYLAALIADLNRLVDGRESSFPVIIQIFKGIASLKLGDEDALKLKFLEMAEGKLMSHAGLLDQLLSKFADADEKLSDQAAQILASIDAQRVLPLMFDMLKSAEEMRLRKRAISFLTRMPEITAPTVREYLGYTGLPWYFIRNLVMLAGDLKDAYAESAVGKHLYDENQQVRKACLTALMKLATQPAAELLAKALPTLDAASQRVVISHLGHVKSQAGVEFMLHKLEPGLVEKDETFAIDLISALGRIGTGKALPAFKKLTRSGGFSGLFRGKPNEKIVLAVLRALEDIGGDDAKNLATKFTRHANPMIAKTAQQVVNKLTTG